MSRWFSLTSTGLLLGAYLALVGCTPTTPPAPAAGEGEHDHDHAEGEHDHDHGEGEHDHDHDQEHSHEGGADHPQTLAEAATRIAATCEAIAAAKADEVDPLVHEVAHLLEDAETLLPAANLDAQLAADARAALDELFAHFEKIDAKLHGQEGADYAELAEPIAAAVKKLQAAVPAEAAEATPEPATSEPATSEPATP